MKILRHLIVTFALLAGSTALAADKIKVDRHFAPGDYTMTESSHQETTSTVGGNQNQTVSDTKFVWQLNVSAPNGQGEKKMACRLTNIQVKENAGGKQAAFDSAAADDGQDPDLVFVFRGLMSAQVQVTLDSDNTVVDVTGLDKFWNDMDQKATTAVQKAAVFEGRLSVSDKTLEMGLRRQEAIMPRDAVAVGDTWKAGARVDLPMIGEIKARYDCKLLEGSTADLAIIQAAGQYESSNPKTTTVQGTDVTINSISVKEQSTLKVDCKSGLVTSDEINMDMNSSFAVKPAGRQEMTGTSQSKSKQVTGFAKAEAGGNPPAATPKVGNPFADNPAPENPFAAAGGGGWAGSFRGDKLSMTLKTDGEKYNGTLTMSGQDYPFTGTATGQKMQGTFKSGGDSFDFTASLDGDTLTFSTAGTTYTLKRGN